MQKSTVVTMLTLAFACAFLSTATGEPPATQPAPLIGAMRPAKLSARSYLCIETDCTIDTMMGKLGPTYQKLEEIRKTEGISWTTGAIIRYPKGIDFNGGHFTMQIGFCVDDDMQDPPAPAHIEDLPVFNCQTVNYTGPMSHLKDGYDALFDAMQHAGLKPAEDFRMSFLYWESSNSNNDVVQLQAGIQ